MGQPTPPAITETSQPQPASTVVTTPVTTAPVPMPTATEAKSRLSDQDWHRQIENLVETVAVSDGKFEHRFRCETPMERMRAETLMQKEEGTVRWIDDEVQSGDVFYDIGANIGIYTLPAAQRVGNEGTVYAFEPHVANVRALLGNVAENQLGTCVKVVSTPLSDLDGFEEFHYCQPHGGSSMSQLGERRDAQEQPFEPCYSEWKFGATIDSLIVSGAIRAADVIKIDVDGNELKVLRGMRELLTGSQPPRSVQVEIHHRGRAEILELMQSYGYQLVDRHFTAMGKQALAAGQDPETLAYMAIFRR